MNITREQAKKHLSNLIDNLLDSEETHYSEHFNIDYHEKAKDILWEYISDKDISEIQERLSNV